MSNQESRVRQNIFNVNNDEPQYYSFSIKTSKCNGSCININDPYARLCVPDAVKNMNIKVLRTNETRHVKLHQICKCKCRLDASVCNCKQRWNKDKCRCECKELINKGICDKAFILNSSNCECEYDNLCNAGQYLGYENYNCRNKLN